MSNFARKHPDFAAIENHIRRAHAERAVTIAAWIAEAIVAAVRAVRGLVRPTPAQPGRLVVRASVTR